MQTTVVSVAKGRLGKGIKWAILVRQAVIRIQVKPWEEGRSVIKSINKEYQDLLGMSRGLISPHVIWLESLELEEKLQEQM